MYSAQSTRVLYLKEKEKTMKLRKTLFILN